MPHSRRFGAVRGVCFLAFYLTCFQYYEKTENGTPPSSARGVHHAQSSVIRQTHAVAEDEAWDEATAAPPSAASPNVGTQRALCLSICHQVRHEVVDVCILVCEPSQPPQLWLHPLAARGIIALEKQRQVTPH